MTQGDWKRKIAALGPKNVGPRSDEVFARLEELAIDSAAVVLDAAWGNLGSGPNGLLVLTNEHLAFVSPAPGPLRVWSLRGLEGGGPRAPLAPGSSWSVASIAGVASSAGGSVAGGSKAGVAESWRLVAAKPESAPVAPHSPLALGWRERGNNALLRLAPRAGGEAIHGSRHRRPRPPPA